MYAKLNGDGQIVKYPYTGESLRNDNPNTSFPVGGIKLESVRTEFSIVAVSSTDQPSYNIQTQKIIEKTPIKDGGQWKQVWQVVAKSDGEKSADDENQWIAVRHDRNRRLAETDWRAGSDLTLPVSWKNYRTALRDVPDNNSNPFDISWPSKPE